MLAWDRPSGSTGRWDRDEDWDALPKKKGGKEDEDWDEPKKKKNIDDWDRSGTCQHCTVTMNSEQSAARRAF